MNRLILTLSAILLGSFVLSAQQRPLLTDDIDITPSGSIEIGVGVDFFQDSKFRLSGIEGDLTRVGNIRIRTGFAPNVEMQIEGTIQNFVSINNRTTSNIPLRVTGNSTNDFDDFISSVKVKLRSETKHIPAIGLNGLSNAEHRPGERHRNESDQHFHQDPCSEKIWQRDRPCSQIQCLWKHRLGHLYGSA